MYLITYHPTVIKIKSYNFDLIRYQKTEGYNDTFSLGGRITDKETFKRQKSENYENPIKENETVKHVKKFD